MSKARFIATLAVVLASLALLALISGFRAAIPSSLDQAVYFSPLHLLGAWLRPDAEALGVFSSLRTQRLGVWQLPPLALALLLHSLLILFLLRRWRP